jgi:hypothetical protein
MQVGRLGDATEVKNPESIGPIRVAIALWTGVPSFTEE